MKMTQLSEPELEEDIDLTIDDDKEEPNTHNTSSAKTNDASTILKLGTISTYTLTRIFGELNHDHQVLTDSDKYLILDLCYLAIATFKGIPENDQYLEISYPEIALAYYSQQALNEQNEQNKQSGEKGKQSYARSIAKRVKKLKASLKKLNLSQDMIEHIPPKNPKDKKGKKEKSKWRPNILTWVKEILDQAKQDPRWKQDWKRTIDKLVTLKVCDLKKNQTLKQAPNTNENKTSYETLVTKLLLKTIKTKQALDRMFNKIGKDISDVEDKAQAENISSEELLHQAIAPITNSLQETFQSRINELLQSYINLNPTNIDNPEPDPTNQNDQNNGGYEQNYIEEDRLTPSFSCHSVPNDSSNHNLNDGLIDQDTPLLGGDIAPDDMLLIEDNYIVESDNEPNLNNGNNLQGDKGVLDPTDLDKADLSAFDNGLPANEALEALVIECVGSPATSYNSKEFDQCIDDQDRPLNCVYFYSYGDNVVKNGDTDKLRWVIRWSSFNKILNNPLKPYEIKNAKNRYKFGVKVKDFKDGLAFSPAKYSVPARYKKNVVGLDILVLDIDGGDLDGYLAICYEMGFRFAYYTTSRYIGDRKNAYFRLLFPFSKLIETDGYLGWWTKMVNIFEADGLTGLDKSGKDVSKMWRFPYKGSEDASYDHEFYGGGDYIDLLISPTTAEEVIRFDSYTDPVSFPSKPTKINGTWYGWMPDYSYFLDNPRYTSDGRIDRSEMDIAFAATAKKRGCSDEDIKNGLRFNSDKFASKGIHGEKYLNNIIKIATRRVIYSSCSDVKDFSHGFNKGV